MLLLRPCKTLLRQRILRKSITKPTSPQKFLSGSTFESNEDHSFTSPLPYRILPFNSAEIDAETLPVEDASEFGSRLYSTFDKCKANGINSIFIRVPMLYSHYIPIAGYDPSYCMPKIG